MPSTAVPADAVPFSSVLAQRVVWVGLCILRRAASNSNVSIRSLGLTSFLAMPPWVLDSLAQITKGGLHPDCSTDQPVAGSRQPAANPEAQNC
eukprot:scaffold2549_cov24-Tisochrysis_lutea.AAC.1